MINTVQEETPSSESYGTVLNPTIRTH